MRQLVFGSLVVAVIALTGNDASAHGRRGGGECCYSYCCEPCCPPICCWCYGLAYRDPYTPSGYMLVYFECCPYCYGWQPCHWVYVNGQWKYGCYWVYVRYLFPCNTQLRDEDYKKAKDGEEVRQKLTATVVVTLPRDAKLMIDDYKTVSTGSSRTFETPPLETGKDYEYTLTAQVVRDGRAQTSTKTIKVRPGEELKVSFDLPVAVAVK